EAAAAYRSDPAAGELRRILRVQQSCPGEFRGGPVAGGRGPDDRPRTGQTHLGDGQPGAALQGGVARQTGRGARGQQVFGVRGAAQPRDLQREGQGGDESEVIGGCGTGGVRGLGPRCVLGGQGGESLPVLGEPCVPAAAQQSGQGGEVGPRRPLIGLDDGDGLGGSGRRQQRRPVEETACRPDGGGDRGDRASGV